MVDNMERVMGKDLQMSADASEVIARKSIRGRKRLREWLALFEELGRFDLIIESKVKTARKLRTISIVIMVVSAFSTIFTIESGLAIISIIALCIGTAGFIFFFFKLKGYAKINLSNYFRDTIAPLFTLLEDDIDPKGKIDIMMDMEQSDAKSKITGKEKLPPGSNRKLIKTTYKNPWCEISFPLINQTRLKLEIDNELYSFDRHYTRRSRSGKTKFKHKRKWKALVTASALLFPDSQRIGLDQQKIESGVADAKIKTARKNGIDCAKLVKKFKYKSSVASQIPNHSIDPQELVGMFIQLCSKTKMI